MYRGVERSKFMILNTKFLSLYHYFDSRINMKLQKIKTVSLKKNPNNEIPTIDFQAKSHALVCIKSNIQKFLTYQINMVR